MKPSNPGIETVNPALTISSPFPLLPHVKFAVLMAPISAFKPDTPAPKLRPA
jgi:hypothetical protein